MSVLFRLHRGGDDHEYALHGVRLVKGKPCGNHELIDTFGRQLIEHGVSLESAARHSER